jgi:hypothetical protein
MAVIDKWPPEWWPFPLELTAFVEQLIPYMDVMQFLYDSAKELVGAIPHQLPEHRRPVNGYVRPLASPQGSVALPIGEVGYNALTRKVIWMVNTEGGPKELEMTLDVSSTIPVLFALILMIPWDVIGEGEAAAQRKAGKDTPPSAADMMQWLFDKVRKELAPTDTKLPALNGDYSSHANMRYAKIMPTVSDIALYNIPAIDFCQSVYEAAMELVETINHHPDPFTKRVYAGGLNVTYQYILQTPDGGKKVSDTMPVLENGQTLTVKAQFSDEDGSHFDSTVL